MKKIIVLILTILMLILIGGCSKKPTADKESDIGPVVKMQTNGVTFTIDKTEKLKEVKPAKPNGYYKYYEENKGYSYFVVTGKAENKGSNRGHSSQYH